LTPFFPFSLGDPAKQNGANANATTSEPSSLPDAYRGDGKRFVVRADEKLTAFVELESVMRAGKT
jgi:hypothetical protein